MGQKARVLALVALLAASPAHALIVHANPVSDREAWDNDGDGIVETLRNESYPDELPCCSNVLTVAQQAAHSFDPGTSRAALEFDVGPPPALPRPRIVSAVLYLNVVASYSLATETDKFQLAVHAYAGDGVVGINDMFVNNVVVGPTYWNAFLMPYTPKLPFNMAIDVTDALVNLHPSDRFFGLMLEGLTPSGGFAFASRENGLWSAPQLRIEVAVPEPESGLLIALGLVALGHAVRRRVRVN